MKRQTVLYLSFLLASAVQAFPLGTVSIEERHVQLEERQLDARALERRQGILDGLTDLVSDTFDPDSDSTSTGQTVSATTVSSDDDDDDDDNDEEETTTSARATRTSSEEEEPTSTESEVESTTSSEEPETTSTSERESSTTSSEESSTTSESSTSSTSTEAAPTDDASASQTPEPSTEDSDNGGASPGVIAGVAVGGVAVIAIVAFLLFAFCPPIKRWRENRAYERMMERSYRPALDDSRPLNETSQLGGLGLSTAGDGYRGVNPTLHPPAPTREFSFTRGSESQAADNSIRRKPLPTLGTGGGTDLVSPLTPGEAQRAEPWLPAGARNDIISPAR